MLAATRRLMRAAPRAGGPWPRRGAAVVALLGALAGPVPARAQPAPPLTVIGLGAGATCADWLAEGGEASGLEQWAFGYLSATAAGVQLRTGADPLAAWDAPALRAWLGERCRARPAEPLGVALIRLVLTDPRR